MDIASNGDSLQQNLKNRTHMTQIKAKYFFKKSIKICVICGLISFLFFTLTDSSFSQSEPPPQITVTPKKVDLGLMKKNEVKLYKIIVGNKGKGDLYITNIPAPNETGISLAKNSIKPGKKIELTFFYKGIDAGKIKDYVSIKSNDPKTPSVKIILNGEVK